MACLRPQRDSFVPLIVWELGNPVDIIISCNYMPLFHYNNLLYTLQRVYILNGSLFILVWDTKDSFSFPE